jgi:peptide/nickel transport system substrate-binding protein
VGDERRRLSYTFTLRDDVTFHDGEPFNAEAVCANFDRWYNWTGLLQSENISYYYNSLFRGFADTDPKGIYESCTADEDHQATITLTSPFAGFVQAMSLPAFSMQSPAAMEEFDADNVSGTEDDVRFSEYATGHPTGTGPFQFEAWERGQQVTLTPYEEYWGDKAKVDQVVIRTISDGNARRQALQNGEIDGYDLVAPGDLASLEEDGFQIEKPPTVQHPLPRHEPGRPGAQGHQGPPGDRARDRQGRRHQPVAARGQRAGDAVHPGHRHGYADDVHRPYEYDPEKAKALLPRPARAT